MFSQFVWMKSIPGIVISQWRLWNCPSTNYYMDNNLVFKQFLVLNTAWYVLPEYQENKRFSASWYWVCLVSWRDLTSDLHNCLVFTMPVNYLVRLSQRENNWRSYLQQNCSPGQSSHCPGRSSDRPEGGGWCQSASSQSASQPGVIITSSHIPP